MKKKLIFIAFLLIFIIILLSLIIKNNQNIDLNKENAEIIEKENKEKIKEVHGEIKHSTDYNNEALDKFLKNFFDKYYKILQTLEYEDVENDFVNKEAGYIYKTAVEILLENRLNKENDLHLLVSDYSIEVKKYSEAENEIKITILENSILKFKFTPEYESHVYNIENNFVITKVNNEYKIKDFKKVQDFFVLITDLYKTTSDDYKAKIDKIKEDYMKLFSQQNLKIHKFKEEYLNNEYNPKNCDNEYNREEARKYAISWVGRRNNEWHTYSANCVNFVSQVMYAGGIPMDYFGTEQWKWYSNKHNTKNEPIGFVYSWTYVPSIVSYFKNNAGYGLCGKYDENIYYGEAGDVIVVGSTGPNRHVITVVDQIKDKDGKVIDLLVNSNTVDLDYFPLSAYAYPYKVLMKVYGWNNK